MADSRTSADSLLLRLAISVLAVLLLAAPPSRAYAASNVLLSGESFGAGGRLAHGGHSFILTDKCNLELDDGVWQSGTAGRGSGCRLTLEGDGRLVVRSEDGAFVWVSSDGSDREGERPAVAVLEPRGRVTVYSPAVWSAPDLGGHQLWGKLGCLKGGMWDNCLIWGNIDHQDLLTSPLLLRQGGRRPHQKLSCLHGGKWDNCIINGGVPAAGNVLFSGARRFRLRGGCGGGRCFLRLDNKGGLAVVDEEDRAIWTNNVRSTEGEYVAVLRRDGAIAVYGPAVWSTAREPVEHQQHRRGSTNVNRKIGDVKMKGNTARHETLHNKVPSGVVYLI
ncbi:hypothetical protein Taro_042900 [Colocasia esculenta]|uniref:Bulb-type lectin domain-containing protein n=1 Tax=Colocasia esculenta TaxID=4460 RepID=A0A843X3B7_COLES|nr:hypothetical protein [Colocasia esculenta]